MTSKPAGISAPLVDAEITQEGSSIRPCQPRQRAFEDAESGPRSGTPEPLTRSERIEKKVRLAKALLADLPVRDSRTRLLTTAIMRRDEVLIDGVLRTLLPHATDRS